MPTKSNKLSTNPLTNKQINKHVASRKSRPKVGMIVCVWYTLFFNKRNQSKSKVTNKQRNYSKIKAIYS